MITNNLLEGFYKYAMEKYYKRRFITPEGIDMFLDLNEIKWYEEVVFQQEIEIPTQNLWEELIRNYTNPYYFQLCHLFPIFCSKTPLILLSEKI